MVTRNATNAATFASAVAASASDDIILLAGGNYGAFSSSRQFAGTLTVKSSNHLTPAIFTEMSLSSAHGWTLEDLKFDLPCPVGFVASQLDGATALGGFYSKRITITRCEVKNNNDANGVQFGRACSWFFAEDMTIQHSKVWQAANGIAFSNCLRTKVLNNEVLDVRGDAIRSYENQDFLAEFNFLHKWRANYALEDHCDGFQIATAVNELQPINNTFRNNIIDIEDGSWIQSVFTRSEVFDATGDNAYRLVNTVIEGNWVRGAYLWGIGLGASTTATIKNNNIMWGAMNASEPYNAASLAAVPGHPGVNSADAVPKIYLGNISGSGFLTGNRLWDAPFFNGARILFDTPQATLIAQGWVINDNLINNAAPGPARPAFITDFGTGAVGAGGAPVTPTLTGTGGAGRTVTFKRG